MIFYRLVLTFLVLSTGRLVGYTLNEEKGYWIGADVDDLHVFDSSLATALGQFFLSERATHVVDFGCGPGDYVARLNAMGLHCEGYDGNPDTPEITQRTCAVVDLSEPFDLKKKFDWVLSLEVGEHLPQQFETIFIENLIRHAKKGIVLSWAVAGQPGYGHFNTQNNDYIKQRFPAYGLVNDVTAEKLLRGSASVHWFPGTIMVFRVPQ